MNAPITLEAVRRLVAGARLVWPGTRYQTGTSEAWHRSLQQWDEQTVGLAYTAMRAKHVAAFGPSLGTIEAECRRLSKQPRAVSHEESTTDDAVMHMWRQMHAANPELTKLKWQSARIGRLLAVAPQSAIERPELERAYQAAGDALWEAGE